MRALLHCWPPGDHAYTRACIDGFIFLGLTVISALLLLLFLRTPPAQFVSL